MLSALFDPENKFWMFIAKVADMFFLQFLWLICCLPIVTIGAATSAFWNVLILMAKDQEGKVFQDFFHAFRTSFKTGTLVWLTHLAIIVLLVLDALICLRMMTVGQSPQVMMFLLGVLAVVGALGLIISFWLYPLAGVYTHFGWKKVMGNSMYLTMRHFPHTISCAVIIGGAIAVCFYIPGAWFILPVLAMYVCAKAAAWVFSHYPNPSDGTAEEEQPEAC